MDRKLQLELERMRTEFQQIRANFDRLTSMFDEALAKVGDPKAVAGVLFSLGCELNLVADACRNKHREVSAAEVEAKRDLDL